MVSIYRMSNIAITNFNYKTFIRIPLLFSSACHLYPSQDCIGLITVAHSSLPVRYVAHYVPPTLIPSCNDSRLFINQVFIVHRSPSDYRSIFCIAKIHITSPAGSLGDCRRSAVAMRPTSSNGMYCGNTGRRVIPWKDKLAILCLQAVQHRSARIEA